MTTRTFASWFGCAALIAVIPAVSVAQIVQDGLVSYWSFDEGTVNDVTVVDATGAHDGEIIGAAPLVQGMVNEGIELDGAAVHVRIETLDISPATFPELTIMAWVYPTSDGTGGQASRRWLFGHDDGDWDRALLMQATNWRLGIGPPDYWDTGQAITVDSWSHVAVTYGADDVVFYLDGSVTAVGEAGVAGPGHPFLLIGAHPSQARFFQGIIDEALVYDRVLGAVEIVSNMNADGLAVDPAGKLATTWGALRALN